MLHLKQKTKFLLILLLFAISYLIFFFSIPKDMPNNLKVELLEKPYGIDTLTPSFSWCMQSSKNSCYQSAYRIVISKSNYDMSNDIFYYDSGWKSSSENTNIKLPNLILSSNNLYYWKVQTRDNYNQVSPYSNAAAFSTGIFDNWIDTTAIWSSNNNDYSFLRGSFSIGKEQFKKIDKVLASVTASSAEKTRQYVFNLFCNSSFVGLGPARAADSSDTYIYNTYDITQYVTPGENIIGSINYTDDSKQFLCQVTIFYEDGTKEIILNSGRDYKDWYSLDADIIYGNNKTIISTPYYTSSGDNIDGTLYPFGWCASDFDTSNWETPQIAGHFQSENLISYSADNVSRYEVTPTTVTYRGDNHYFIDLGREIVGGLSLSLVNNTSASFSITIRSGEELDSEGNVQYKMRTGNTYEEIWNIKSGTQKLENVGMKTFRYIDIFNCPIALTTNNVKALAIRQEFTETESSFRSSNNLLNDIYNLAKYTIKATNQDLYVDSQCRERAPYEGDAIINAMTSYALEDDYTLARYSNEWLFANPTWPAEYKLFSINCAWNDYMYTGNIDSLTENYDILKSKLFTENLDSQYGLVRSVTTEETQENSVLVDWPKTERDEFAYSEAAYNTVFNAISYGAYVDMANIAHALDKYVDEAYFASQANKIKTSMISYLYDEKKGAYCDGLTTTGNEISHYSQHATAFALAYGVYTDNQMADQMTEYLKSQGKIKMSPYGSYFLLKGLYNSNNGDYANTLLTSSNIDEGARTWAYMLLKSNATITTEAWNTTTKDNMTYSHPWAASPATLITTGLFGIQPTLPAFSNFQIKFQPGKIKSASIKVPTLKGSISAAYQLDRELNISFAAVTIPPNTSATIYIPTTSINIIVNNQRVVAEKDGFYQKISLESGTYSIKIS